MPSNLFKVLTLSCLLLPTTLSAQPAEGPLRFWNWSRMDERHYPGERFISTRPIKVTDQPHSAGRILADVGSGILLYAKQQPGSNVYAVYGYGSRRYPDIYSGFRTVDLDDNGKLDLPPATDRDWYSPLIGFVTSDTLLSLDQSPALLPANKPRTIPVDQLWADLGITDARFVAAGPSESPIDSLVQVHAHFEGSVETCTGFFVGDGRTVATAGHCVAPRDGVTPNAIEIEIERSPRKRERVAGTVLQYELSDGRLGFEQDWALIRLSRAPHTPHQPLELHDGSGLAGVGQARFLVIGYPADMAQVYRRSLRYTAPTVVECPSPLTRSAYDREAGILRLKLIACPIWWGNSGSPVLLWNASTHRYEVIGIEGGGGLDAIAYDGLFDLSGMLTSRAIAAIRTHAVRLAQENGYAPTVGERSLWYSDKFSEFGASFVNIPGNSSLVLAVRKAAGAYSASDFAFLSRSFARAVDKASARDSVSSFLSRIDTNSALSFAGDPEYDAFTGALGESELIRKAREFCALNCTPKMLDYRRQLRSTLGDNLVQPLAPSSEVLEITPASLGIDKAKQATIRERMFVVGGDLLVVEAGRLTSALRNFMLLTDSAEQVREISRFHGRPNCEQREVEDDLPDKWADEVPGLATEVSQLSPARLDGIITVSARQAACLQRRLGKTLVVLSAISAEWGIPAATSINWASTSGDLSDSTQDQLRLQAQTLVGHDLSRPILVYCHHQSCLLSVNLAKRLLGLGYRNIYWLRSGLNGWIAAEYPLERVVKTQDPPHLPQREETPAPPKSEWHMVRIGPQGSSRVEVFGVLTREYRRESTASRPLLSYYASDADNTSYLIKEYSGDPGKTPNEQLSEALSRLSNDESGRSLCRFAIGDAVGFDLRHKKNELRVRERMIFDRNFSLLLVAATKREEIEIPSRDAAERRFFDSIRLSNASPSDTPTECTPVVTSREAQ